MGTVAKSAVLAASIFLSFINAGLADDVHVRGYFRSDGTWVRPHIRKAPNQFKWDNYGPSRTSRQLMAPRERDADRDGIPNYLDTDDNNDGLHDDFDRNQYSNGRRATLHPLGSARVIAPQNASVIGSSWFCNTGYKRVGSECAKVIAPQNASVIGSSWFCNTGYKKVGSECAKVIAPQNASVIGSSWFCNTGYKRVGSECAKVIAPQNASVIGSSWFCNTGYKKVGGSCEPK